MSSIECIQMKTQEFGMNTNLGCQLAGKKVGLATLNEVSKEVPWELD